MAADANPLAVGEQLGAPLFRTLDMVAAAMVALAAAIALTGAVIGIIVILRAVDAASASSFRRLRWV